MNEEQKQQKAQEVVKLFDGLTTYEIKEILEWVGAIVASTPLKL